MNFVALVKYSLKKQNQLTWVLTFTSSNFNCHERKKNVATKSVTASNISKKFSRSELSWVTKLSFSITIVIVECSVKIENVWECKNSCKEISHVSF